MENEKKTEDKVYTVKVAFEGHAVGEEITLSDEAAKPLVDEGKIELKA